MAKYKVHCSQLDETEIHIDKDKAVDICFSMHHECGGYAYVQIIDGPIIYEYGEKK